MTFGLGAAAAAGLLAATTAVVAALYLLRPPPRRFLVASTLLWQRAIEERSRRLRDRRFWLSLLASLGFAWAIAAALADPSWRGSESRIVVIVDNSVTMATRTISGSTRLDRAVERARSVMQGSELVLLADSCGQIAEREFVARHVAARLLERLSVCLEPKPVLPRLDVPEDSRGFVITDGIGLPETPGDFETLSVFERVENVAIEAFAVRRVAGRPDAFEAYLAIVNQGAEAHDVEVEIVGAAPPLAGRERLEPGETVARAISLSEFAEGGVEARIRVEGDAFSLDDVAYDVLPSPAIPVRLRAGHPSLARALALAPDLELASRNEELAVVVSTSSPMVAATLSAHLEFLTTDEAVALTDPVEIRPGHPLLRGVSPDDLIARTAAPLRVRDDEEWLARAGDSLLIVARGAHPRRIRVALSLDDSALTRRAGFPVLFANAVRWLAGSSRIAKPVPGTAMVPISLDSLRGPEGEIVGTLSLAGTSVFEARRPGLFTGEVAGVSRGFGIDLAHAAATGPNESALPASAPEATTEQRSQPNAWRVLIALALALAIVDRWAFARRFSQ